MKIALNNQQNEARNHRQYHRHDIEHCVFRRQVVTISRSISKLYLLVAFPFCVKEYNVSYHKQEDVWYDQVASAFCKQVGNYAPGFGEDETKEG